MKLTIIRPDGLVGVDGIFLKVDLALTSNKLRVVQWDGEKGHEEWTDKGNTELLSLYPYQHIINAWQATKAEMDTRAADPYYGMTAEQILAAREFGIRQRYDNQLAALGRPYMENEQKSWAVQEAEARAYLADDTATVPYITTMATTRGIPVAIMAAKIIENAELFRAESARILGEQQREIDLLNG